MLQQYFFIPILVGVVLALLGPNMFLNSKDKSHQGAIRAQLADTLDLMSVCMEAGLSFDASLVKISERMEGPLIDELITVFKQIQLGRNRNDALKDLSNSTDVDELKTFRISCSSGKSAWYSYYKCSSGSVRAVENK